MFEQCTEFFNPHRAAGVEVVVQTRTNQRLRATAWDVRDDGLLLAPERELPADGELFITFACQCKDTWRIHRVRARVNHHSDRGLGVAFQRAEAALETLRRYRQHPR